LRLLTIHCPISTTSKSVREIPARPFHDDADTEADLSWFEGLKNTGKDAEVYAPQSDPNGLIHCIVTRD